MSFFDNVDFEYKLDDHIRNFLNRIINENIEMCNIITSGDYYTYPAIDDVFKSATGNYYMKVFLDGIPIEINIKKIESVYNSKNPELNDWQKFKEKLLRIKKIKNVLNENN